jgi:hypothetical protein
MIIFQPRKPSQTNIWLQLIKTAVEQDKPTIIATHDIRSTIARLLFYFPGALFVVVEDWGVKMYQRKVK